MLRWAVLLLLLCSGAWAQSAVSVVSAASYGAPVSPDSLVTIFGNQLAQTAQGTLDSNGQLPTLLGGASVQVNGVSVPLVYTSASQINFYLPPSVATGAASVTVSNSAGAPIGQGTADVRTVAPALFALDGSGRGPAAVQNAVTYAGPPFLVITPQIASDDQRTRLVVYGTGFRAAVTNNLTISAIGQLPTGGSVSIPVQFPVEYAGATPGFFGLDQLNLVLPPELDGVGTVTLTLFLGNQSSNAVTFAVGSVPSASIALSSLTLAQSSVPGGQGVSGTVTLTAPARLTGYIVTLRSANNSVQTPGSVTVPVGQTTATFSLTTSTVSTSQNVQVTAQGGAVTRSVSLRVDPANLATLTNIALSTTQVTGGTSVTGTVTLSNPAPIGGTAVTITADGSLATAPRTVTVPLGQTSTTFTITTLAVTQPATINFTATAGGVSATVPLVLNPALLLSLGAQTAASGTALTGSVTLGQIAPVGGTTVTLRSNNTALQVPGVVTVPAQSTTVSFPITTTAVFSNQTVTVTASYNGLQNTAQIVLTPATSTALSSVTVSPASIAGGGTVQGTVSLTAPAPAGGVLVSLSSTNLAAQLPPSVTIPAGQAVSTFQFTTLSVPQNTTVTITANSGGQRVTTTLTITH